MCKKFDIFYSLIGMRAGVIRQCYAGFNPHLVWYSLAFSIVKPT